ncbi:MAG: MMPL family transporter [Proteobacteria bacterium]|nr:MMPL family transporter [Pseudomonadota bacterium]
MTKLPAENNHRSKVVEKLDRIFEKTGGWSYDHRWVILFVCIMVFGLCLYLAKDVRFDNSFEAYFDRDDPVYKGFLEFRDHFGSDEIGYILYEAPEKKYGVWDLAVMRTIDEISIKIEENAPFVKRVLSLSNAEFIEGRDGELIVHDILNDFPETQEDMLKIRDKVLAKPLYLNGLADASGRFGAIVVEMHKSSIDQLEEIQVDPEKGNDIYNLYPQASAMAIKKVLSAYENTGIVFYNTGDVELNSEYNIMAMKESQRLGMITFIVIGILLAFFLRSFSGIVGPLSVVALSMLISVSFIGIMGWKFDLLFSILPTVLIAVGVADSVHIVSDFRTYYKSLNDRRGAIKRTLYLTGLPCLFTSLTTVAGFASMAISPIKIIKHFAIYSAVGIFGAFVLSVTFLVVFLSFGKKSINGNSPEKSRKKDLGNVLLKKSLQYVARFDIRYKWTIIIVSLIVGIFAAGGVLQIRIDSNFLSEFSDKVDIKRVTKRVDEVMGGTISYSYVFNSEAPEGIIEPEVLAEIKALQDKANEMDIVMKTYSIVDLLQDINKTFHDEDPDYYVLPDTKAQTAQYLLVYEMSGGEELENYITSSYGSANLEIRTKLANASETEKFVDSMDRFLQSRNSDAIKPILTGMGALWYKLIKYIVQSQIAGFLIAFSVIAVMMCVLFGSVRVGLLSMVPNLAPVVLTLGVMGWAGVPLDYVKLMIGCISIGIAVDDTIHLVNRYQHEFRRCGNYEKALLNSMNHVGRAIFITSVVLFSGFLVFLNSLMDSLAQFGVLVSATIITAFMADFFLMPALLLALKPFGPEFSIEE